MTVCAAIAREELEAYNVHATQQPKTCILLFIRFEDTFEKAPWRKAILSYITGGAPDLQCKFENHWRPGLSRPGRPIVQFTADLEP